MPKDIFVLTLLVFLTALLGCSGSVDGGPTLPNSDLGSMSATGGKSDIRDGASGADGHVIMGLYQFVADPERGTLDVTPLRTGEFHLNVLPFLEPPPFVYLTLESLEFNGDIIEADIGLRHPFLTLVEFSGFDVSGIIITNGSYAGFNDSGLRYAGSGDTRLLNPDGYSRWWNPNEFPINPSAPIFGYTDGLLGAPDSFADYNSTLNGYKYFCDDLDDPDTPLTEVTLESRGVFTAGQKIVRHYSIKLGDEGLIFNYAIDASWEFPGGLGPWEAPEDFGPGANRVEPWFITVTETGNTLYYEGGGGGGELSLLIDVYDWFNSEQNSLYAEAAAGVIPQVGPLSPTGGGEGYSTYEVDITEAHPTMTGDLDILITVETEQDDFQDFIPGTKTSAYLIYTTTVAGEIPELDPIGNLTLSTGRTGVDPDPVTGITLSWADIDNEAEYAIYIDQDPYGDMPTAGLDDDMVLLDTVTANATSYTHDASSPTPLSGNAAYCYEVRARAVAGNPGSEKSESELAFCELESFEGGTGSSGGTWVSRSQDSNVQYTESGAWVMNGATSFSAINIMLGWLGTNDTTRLDVHSPELPTVPDYEMAEFQFTHQHTYESSLTNQFIAKMAGTSSIPLPNGITQITYFDIVSEENILHDSFNYDTGYHWTGYGSPFWGTWGVDGGSHPDWICNYCGHYRWLPNGIDAAFSAFDLRETFDGPGGYDDGDRYFGLSAARPAQIMSGGFHSLVIDDIAVLIY